MDIKQKGEKEMSEVKEGTVGIGDCGCENYTCDGQNVPNMEEVATPKDYIITFSFSDLTKDKFNEIMDLCEGIAIKYEYGLDFEVVQDEKSNIESWAEREIRLAYIDNPEIDEECGYSLSCANSALGALKSLSKDGHSGFSIHATKHILNRLIDWKPLSAITDIPEVWNTSYEHDDEQVYQCSRYSALFKHVPKDGSSIWYSDVDRVVCVDMDNPDMRYTNGLVRRTMEELFPITLPYMPTDKRIEVYCEEFLTDRKNGDYDTVGIRHCILPDGEIVTINRFFKEDGDIMKRIGYFEYLKRKRMDKNRQLKEIKEAAMNKVVERGLRAATTNPVDDAMVNENGQSE